MKIYNKLIIWERNFHRNEFFSGAEKLWEMSFEYKANLIVETRERILTFKEITFNDLLNKFGHIPRRITINQIFKKEIAEYKFNNIWNFL